MDHVSLLNAAVMVFGAALSAAWLFRVVRLPSIIGFLVAGMATGPSGLDLIPQPAVGQFSEFGLILLLFTIGVELSPEPLLRIGSRLVAITLIQVALTAGVAFLLLTGFAPLGGPSSLILGIAVALSSTAIVLKQLSDRGEARSSTGMITTGILLLQDVLVILVMLLLSIMAGKGELRWGPILVRGSLGVATLIGIFFGLPGLIAGPFVGAFVGELAAKRDLAQAGRAGVGSWIGLMVGMVVRVGLVFSMIGLFVMAYFV